jgi:hypothetical protein
MGTEYGGNERRPGLLAVELAEHVLTGRGVEVRKVKRHVHSWLICEDI